MSGRGLNRWNTSASALWVVSFGIVVFLLCLLSSHPFPFSEDRLQRLDFSQAQSRTLFSEGHSSEMSVGKLLPKDYRIPEDAVSARLTINPPVNAWFNSEMMRTLGVLSRNLSESGDGLWPETVRVNAVLIDSDSKIRVMYSNSVETYFGSNRLPLASTAKIFVAVGLGKYDDATARYCIPRAVTNWLTIDAARSSLCPVGVPTVSASTAFARSMPAPLLWRSHQVLTDHALNGIFLQFGIALDAFSSLRDAAIMGQVRARPIEMHRAVHAVTLALAESNADARIPTIVDAIETRGHDGRIQDVSVDRPSVPSVTYRRGITPSAVRYLREVLNAPIRAGTLQSLSGLNRAEAGIDFVWGKTGTYSVRGRTRNIWIVGGAEVGGAPYSWIVLINSAEEKYSLGNTNAAAFAPIARLLIEAAVRNGVAESAVPMRRPVN